MSTIVSRWFGSRFTDLHPLLQDLHLHGGKLTGGVNLEYPKGFVGFLGKRLAAKIGLPCKSGIYELEVDISHNDKNLFWRRTFNNTHVMKSVFTPHGFYPEGFWSEKTGFTELFLAVEIFDGGWYWKQKKMFLFGKELPHFLLPSASAYKSVKNDMYEFSVSLSFPLLGQFVKYGGALKKVEKT
jgi:Domain of unknown function (DUF4166)